MPLLLATIDLDHGAGESLADPVGQQVDLEQIDDRSLVLLGPSFRRCHLLGQAVERTKDPSRNRLISAQSDADFADVSINEPSQGGRSVGVIAGKCGMVGVVGYAPLKLR